VQPLWRKAGQEGVHLVLHYVCGVVRESERKSVSDWRWAPEGALARGEETGAGLVHAMRAGRDAPGSDRRVLQRPEEPTPVAQ
jgi:hypothetical protein